MKSQHTSTIPPNVNPIQTIQTMVNFFKTITGQRVLQTINGSFKSLIILVLFVIAGFTQQV